jgi:stage V sporulation protein SpoVS
VLLDEIVLKVGVSTDPAAFAGALYKNVAEGRRVSARAFGASANYTMSKGIAIAHQYFESHGQRMFCQLSTRKETNAKREGGFDDRDIRSFTMSFFVIDKSEECCLGDGL